MKSDITHESPTLIDTIKRELGFNGREGRSKYWGTQLILIVAIIFTVGLWSENAIIDVLLLALCGVSIWWALAVQVKRFHDLGHSGWAMLVLAVPIVNWVVWIYPAFFPGQSGPNRFDH